MEYFANFPAGTGAEPVNLMQPYIAINYIIATLTLMQNSSIDWVRYGSSPSSRPTRPPRSFLLIS